MSTVFTTNYYEFDEDGTPLDDGEREMREAWGECSTSKKLVIQVPLGAESSTCSGIQSLLQLQQYDKQEQQNAQRNKPPFKGDRGGMTRTQIEELKKTLEEKALLKKQKDDEEIIRREDAKKEEEKAMLEEQNRLRQQMEEENAVKLRHQDNITEPLQVNGFECALVDNVIVTSDVASRVRDSVDAFDAAVRMLKKRDCYHLCTVKHDAEKVVDMLQPRVVYRTTLQYHEYGTRIPALMLKKTNKIATLVVVEFFSHNDIVCVQVEHIKLPFGVVVTWQNGCYTHKILAQKKQVFFDTYRTDSESVEVDSVGAVWGERVSSYEITVDSVFVCEPQICRGNTPDIPFNKERKRKYRVEDTSQQECKVYRGRVLGYLANLTNRVMSAQEMSTELRKANSDIANPGPEVTMRYRVKVASSPSGIIFNIACASTSYIKLNHAIIKDVVDQVKTGWLCVFPKTLTGTLNFTGKADVDSCVVKVGKREFTYNRVGTCVLGGSFRTRIPIIAESTGAEFIVATSVRVVPPGTVINKRRPMTRGKRGPPKTNAKPVGKKPNNKSTVPGTGKKAGAPRFGQQGSARAQRPAGTRSVNNASGSGAKRPSPNQKRPDRSTARPGAGARRPTRV